MEDPELAHFFNREMIEQYRGFGGVRIEVQIVSAFQGHIMSFTLGKSAVSSFVASKHCIIYSKFLRDALRRRMSSSRRTAARS
jgi:hypothetical protein